MKRLLVLSTFLLSSQWAFAGPFGAERGQWSLLLGADFYSTKANFNHDAAIEDLPDGYGFDYQLYNLTGRYDFSGKFSSFLNIAMVQAKSTSPTDDRARFAVPYLQLGTDYSLVTKAVTIVPEAKFKFPVAENDQNADEVFVDEGVWEFQMGAYVSKKFSIFESYGYVGVNMRGDGRATLLPWAFHLNTRIKSFSIGAEISGFESISDDEATGFALDRQIAGDTLNGQSYIFTSINPSLMELKAWVGAEIFRGFEIIGGYSMDLRGVRMSQGSSIFGLLQYTVRPGFSGGPAPLRYQNINEESAESDFKVEKHQSEEVFQKALEPDKPKPKKKKKKPKKKRKKRKKKKKKPEQTTDEQVDDIEKNFGKKKRRR